MDLGLGRGELRQDSTESKCILAQRRPHPVVSRGRRVALIEDQVDHFEDRGEARHALGAARHLKPRMRFGEGPLRPHDALGDRRDRYEEGPRDLLSRQAAEDTQRESNS